MPLFRHIRRTGRLHPAAQLKELHTSLDKALELISTLPASVTALDSSLVQALEAENARRQQKQDPGAVNTPPLACDSLRV